MELLEKVGKRAYDIDGHVGYVVGVPDMNVLVKAWSKNREMDLNRVAEIAVHLRRGGWVKPEIYVAHLPQEGLVCYDGNHRREAYKTLSRENAKDCSNKKVVLDVLKDWRKIYDCFTNVNLSVHVSQAYLNFGVAHANVRDELDGLVRGLERRFPGFVSSSHRCHAPHFNRDQLKDQLFSFVETKEFRVSVGTLRNALDLLNDAFANDERPRSHHDQLRDAVREKCEAGGLWLFAFRRDISDEDLGWAVRRAGTGDLIEV